MILLEDSVTTLCKLVKTATLSRWNYLGNAHIMHIFMKVVGITAMMVVYYGRCVNVTRDPKQPGQLQQQSGLFIGCGTLSDALFYQ